MRTIKRTNKTTGEAIYKITGYNRNIYFRFSKEMQEQISDGAICKTIIAMNSQLDESIGNLGSCVFTINGIHIKLMYFIEDLNDLLVDEIEIITEEQLKIFHKEEKPIQKTATFKDIKIVK